MNILKKIKQILYTLRPDFRRYYWCISNGFSLKLAFCCDIPPSVKIDRSVGFPHPVGIVIAHDTVIGKGSSIMQNVTLAGHNGIMPEIGENTMIGAGAFIRGVRIGNNCIIGAHAIVLKDVPDNSFVVGIYK